MEKEGHLEEPKKIVRIQDHQPATTQESAEESAPESDNEEFDDLPDLEEPDIELVSPGQSSEPAVKEQSEIIELNAPSATQASIFSGPIATTSNQSSNIFTDLIPDSSDVSDDDEEAEETPSSGFMIEEVSSSAASKPMISEVNSNLPNIEELTVTEPKKNPFLITECHSSDINDMFCRQDDLLDDEVEKIYVGDAMEEAETATVVPQGDGFLDRLGKHLGPRKGNL